MWRERKIWLVFLGLCTFLGACERFGLTVLNATAIPLNKSTSYKDLAYGENARQKLDLYFPETYNSKTPVVVFFYGGSWQSGDKKDYRFMAEALNSRGYVVAIPDYRLYPEVRFPAFIEDGAAAVSWLKKHLSDYKVSAEHIYVMGHSAGALTAALLTFDESYAVREKWPPHLIKGFIGLAGPYDFLPLRDPILQKIFAPASPSFRKTQPIFEVDGHEAPVLLMQGKKDKTVDPKNSYNLAHKINERGGKAQLKLYPTFGHISIVSRFGQFARRNFLLDDVQGFISETEAGQSK